MSQQKADEEHICFEKLNEASDVQIQGKLILTGDGAVGKSGLLQVLRKHSLEAVERMPIVTLPTGEHFYTSTQASEITGCTRRQLQYWREKEVIVPQFNTTGTGRNVYYSDDDLLVLVLMDYMLSVGLDFQLSSRVLEEIRQQNPSLLKFGQFKRFMLCRDSGDQQLELLEFDLEQAIAALRDGQPAIPFWLDVIQNRLVEKLEKWLKSRLKSQKNSSISQSSDLSL